MAHSIKRCRKIADLIRQDIVTILKKEVNDPRLQSVSIIHVEVTPDLGTAKIYFFIPEASQLSAVHKALVAATGFLRSALADRCGLRYVPKLRFIYDKSIETGARISDLIASVQSPIDPHKKDDD